ncbi:MAG TPA: hypothetical protein VG295_08770 [Solirubrobacteraceae bacterium]|nr:hypothetical protein [Solirubrobacteraceae bacterium]
MQQIQAFKREQGLEAGTEGEGGAPVTEFDDEIDLRAEDDALIAAELEAAAAARAEADAAEAAAAEAEGAAAAEDGESDGEDGEGDEDGPPARRRRGRRGGTGRSGAAARARRKTTTGTLEGTFDHGDEGYGLWLDPAVQDDPVYAEYWAGHRPVEITIEEEQIVIRRAGVAEEDG